MQLDREAAEHWETLRLHGWWQEPAGKGYSHRTGLPILRPSGPAPASDPPSLPPILLSRHGVQLLCAGLVLATGHKDKVAALVAWDGKRSLDCRRLASPWAHSSGSWPQALQLQRQGSCSGGAEGPVGDPQRVLSLTQPSPASCSLGEQSDKAELLRRPLSSLRPLRGEAHLWLQWDGCVPR